MSKLEPEFICPKCGSRYFGRDTVVTNGGVMPLSTVTCHGRDSNGKPNCHWRGEWPPRTDPVIVSFTGNILLDPSQAYVNTVNCVGVSGKGIARLFKEAFTANQRFYEHACRVKKSMKPGSVLVFDRGGSSHPRYIFNMATKDDWRNPSELNWIAIGLSVLCVQVDILRIKTMAIPALGCGNGGLDWKVVRPMIVGIMKNTNLERVNLYEPHES